MPNAIVTGATGILGRQIVSELAKNPQQWPTVYALSRSKKESYPDNVKHSHIDLTSNAEDMAKDLQNVDAEYVFFAAYLQKDDEAELTKVNGAMLQNFLDALKLTGMSKKIKRVVLTTGAKQYGVHLGRPKLPMEESDRWITGEGRPPNFYYRQQEILSAAAKEEGWDWVVTYPNDVIGVAHGNFMNLSSAIGIYAAVTKELGKELIFPGSPAFYTMFDCYTSSKIHGQFNAWAALSPTVSNQAYNIHNGDAESWQNMWPKLAKKFGLKIPETMFSESDYAGKFGDDGLVMPLMEKAPLDELAAERGLKGSNLAGQSRVAGKIDLSKWAQKAEVKEAWSKLAKREGLHEDALEKATWVFLNFVLGREYDLIISMTKARKAGWKEYEDSWDALEDALDSLVDEKILPKF